MQLEPLCDALRTEFYELFSFETRIMLTYADVC